MADNTLQSIPAGEGPIDESGLLSLLDREIEHARTDRSRFGWSRWGLLITVGGLLWGALREHQRAPYILPDAAAWFVIGSLLADLVLDDIVQRWDVTGDPRRLRIGSFLGRRPMGIAAIVLRSAAIVWATIIASPVLSLAAMLAVISFYVVMGALLLLILVAVSQGFPTQAGFTPATRTITYGLPGIAFLGLLLSFASTPFPRPGASSTPLVVGILVALAVYLWVVLMGDRHRDPLLESLVEIRRDLILRETDLASAFNRSVVTLRGLAFSDWVQRDVQELEELYQRVVGYERTIEEMADLTVKDFQLLGAGRSEDAAQTRLAIRSRLDAMNLAAREMQTSYSRISDLSAEIAGKVGYVKSMDSSLSEEGAHIDAALTPLADDAMRRTVRIEVQLPHFVSDANKELGKQD